MNFLLQGMGDFLDEMLTMMSQTKSNVSHHHLVSGVLGQKAMLFQCCLFYYIYIYIFFCLVDKARHIHIVFVFVKYYVVYSFSIVMNGPSHLFSPFWT